MSILGARFDSFAYLYTSDIAKQWCQLNKITAILRSHEVRQDGYEEEHDGLTVTIFSASNYVDQVGNKGAFARIDAQGSVEYIQFDAQPHPNMRPMHCEYEEQSCTPSFIQFC